ncbi:hypothetical protein [Actinomadura monticuli]|uniref:Serine/threonine protein kinase n=1 Tax=Actinomadura monticuli TaxID=3097367 RepID=A0ABV4Q347_9ACTN
MDTEPRVPRRPGGISNTPAHGFPKATPREGTPVRPAGAPVPPGAPTRPIVQAPPAAETPPSAWGTPPPAPAEPGVPRSGGLPQPGGLPQTLRVPGASTGPGRPASPPPEPGRPLGGARVGDAAWAGVPEAQDAYSRREGRSSTTGPMGVRETSGVQVRIGPRERERERQERRRAGRRSGLVAAGVLVLAGLVTIGLLLTPGSGDDGGGTGTAPAGGEQQPGADGALPKAGAPITVGTADGSKYKIAAVTDGVSDGVVTSSQSSPPSGTSFAYIEYILSNPTGEKVLLDFPGDVFLKRDLVTPDARGRCMPQAGVPEDMCTPPTKSQVVRRLAGGELVAGDGGDKYLPPGSAFLVRATVDVPVDQGIKRTDLGLYVWKQLYMADQLAKQAPFPR